MGDVRVGTSGWSYPSWAGPFYPERTPASRMLEVYARTFRAVEAHATHRRAPAAAALARWVAQVPDGFRFAPKAHMGITHRRDTDGLGERVSAFFAAVAPLGDRLGPVLFVLPHRQPDLARLDLLLDALEALDGRQRRPAAVFELAPPWRVPEVLERLDGHGATLAVVDREDDPASGQPVVGPLTYVRLRRPSYTGPELDEWAGRLAAASGRGDVYAFVKHDEEGSGPRYARDLVKRLERR
jgi:uncharacterized protein YecE (DUF72 family)